MKNYKLLLITVLLILTAGISGCVEKTPPEMQTQTNDVMIKNFSFQPSSINVTNGTTVTWTNDDSVEHTVTSSDGIFNSGNIAPGNSVQFYIHKTRKIPVPVLDSSLHGGLCNSRIRKARCGTANATDPSSTDTNNVGNNMTNQSCARGWAEIGRFRLCCTYGVHQLQGRANVRRRPDRSHQGDDGGWNAARVAFPGYKRPHGQTFARLR